MNQNKIAELFNNKAFVGGVAEKACRNFSFKSGLPLKDTKEEKQVVMNPERLRYFAVGHAFKNIPPTVFDTKIDETGKTYSENFPNLFDWYHKGDVSKVADLLKAIRDLNSHYLHTFSQIRVDAIEDNLIAMIRKAFMFAVKLVNEGKDMVDEVAFVATRFIPEPERKRDMSVADYRLAKKGWKERVDTIKKMSLDAAADYFLFIDVDDDFMWQIGPADKKQDLLAIQQGRYLSFNACLFFLSMFLYRHETQMLLSRIKGFKRTDNNQYRSKLDLFKVFSKKVSSQDVDSEETNIVRFFDMVSYLNRFPTIWNDTFNRGTDYKGAVAGLKNYLDERYRKEHGLEGEVSSYTALFGRNQDKFMLYAARFFAETNYFGETARFKCYLYDSMQREERVQQALELGVKERDRLKYHQGRLVGYVTYREHLEKYPDWDMPFVVQADTFKVKLVIDTEEVIVNIQRELAAFLLEKALYGDANGYEMLSNYYAQQRKERQSLLFTLQEGEAPVNAKNARKLLPKKLLQNYMEVKSAPVDYRQLLLLKALDAQDRYQEMKRQAEKEGRLDDFLTKNKGKHFKLEFVRRAWHYMSFREQYRSRKSALSTSDRRQTSDKGHHKSLHITRDQFNDFSRWMYSFDVDNVQAKNSLAKLFGEIGFLDDLGFKQVFEESSSFASFFDKTLTVYRSWLEQQASEEFTDGKYRPENYQKLLEEKILYVNIAHFKTWLHQGQIFDRYSDSLLANRDKLVGDFYARSYFGLFTSNWGACSATDKKLHRKLVVAQYEDAMLYRLAWYYRSLDHRVSAIPESQQAPVDVVFNQHICIQVKNASGNTQFQLVYPFKKLDRLAEDLWFQGEQEAQWGVSFLEKIGGYLELLNSDYSHYVKEKTDYVKQGKGEPSYKDVLDICREYKKTAGMKTLTDTDLYVINAHIVKCCFAIAKEVMRLEKEYIYSQKVRLEDGKTHKNFNNMPWCKIDGENTRNLALHFGIPTKNSYGKIVEKIRKQGAKQPIIR